MGVSLASDFWIHVEIKIYSIYKIHFQQSKKYFFASFYFFSCNGIIWQVLVTLICTTHMITVSTYYLWLTDLTGISCNFNLMITVKRWKSKNTPFIFLMNCKQIFICFQERKWSNSKVFVYECNWKHSSVYLNSSTWKFVPCQQILNKI